MKTNKKVLFAIDHGALLLDNPVKNQKTYPKKLILLLAELGYAMSTKLVRRITPKKEEELLLILVPYLLEKKLITSEWKYWQGASFLRTRSINKINNFDDLSLVEYYFDNTRQKTQGKNWLTKNYTIRSIIPHWTGETLKSVCKQLLESKELLGVRHLDDLKWILMNCPEYYKKISEFKIQSPYSKAILIDCGINYNYTIEDLEHYIMYKSGSSMTYYTSTLTMTELHITGSIKKKITKCLSDILNSSSPEVLLSKMSSHKYFWIRVAKLCHFNDSKLISLIKRLYDYSSKDRSTWPNRFRTITKKSSLSDLDYNLKLYAQNPERFLESFNNILSSSRKIKGGGFDRIEPFLEQVLQKVSTEKIIKFSYYIDSRTILAKGRSYVYNKKRVLIQKYNYSLSDDVLLRIKELIKQELIDRYSRQESLLGEQFYLSDPKLSSSRINLTNFSSTSPICPIRSTRGFHLDFPSVNFLRFFMEWTGNAPTPYHLNVVTITEEGEITDWGIMSSVCIDESSPIQFRSGTLKNKRYNKKTTNRNIISLNLASLNSQNIRYVAIIAEKENTNKNLQIDFPRVGFSSISKMDSNICTKKTSDVDKGFPFKLHAEVRRSIPKSADFGCLLFTLDLKTHLITTNLEPIGEDILKNRAILYNFLNLSFRETTFNLDELLRLNLESREAEIINRAQVDYLRSTDIKKYHKINYINIDNIHLIIPELLL